MWWADQDAEVDRIDSEIPDDLKMKVPGEGNGEGKKKPKTLLEYLLGLKDAGNKSLKANESTKAIQTYSKAIKGFEDAAVDASLAEEVAAAQSTYVTLVSNLSQAYLNIKDFEKAILAAQKAVSVDPGHVKAYFRMGKSLV
jgi:tetratricopeptide (TPR) repeat protein